MSTKFDMHRTDCIQTERTSWRTWPGLIRVWTKSWTRTS